MSLLSSHRLDPRVRYAIDWRRLSEALAVMAAAALWIGFLLHGG
jgi:hypothetical protein